MKMIYVIIGVVGAAALIAPSMLKRMFLGLTESEEKEELEKAVLSVDVVKANVNKSETNLRSRADTAYLAMKGPQTDEEILFEQFEGLSSDEKKKVFVYFGVRSESVFGWPFFTSNLLGWFYSELGGSDLERMKEIWKDTGLWK